MSNDEIWRALVAYDLCTEPRVAELQEQYRAQQAEDNGQMLASWLVLQGVLTAYQAGIVLGASEGPLRLGPYDVLGPIESGRLAGIYRARHYRLQFPVCLKLLRPAGTAVEIEQQLARFQREARVSVQIDHPHTVRTYQMGQDIDIFFIAFEDLYGETLADVLEADSVLAEGSYAYADKLWDELHTHTRPAEVCRLIREAALGLAHLHSQGIVHRDVRPDNLWITADFHIKVMDFGLARDALAYLDPSNADRSAAGSEEFLGAASYMSLEQALESEAATPQSDIYSLGCTFYHALTGQPPFAAATPAKTLLLNATQTPVPPSQLNEEVGPQIDEIVAGMMAKNPQDRYPTATAVAEALDGFIHPENQASYEAVQSPQLQEFLRWAAESPILTPPSPGSTSVRQAARADAPAGSAPTTKEPTAAGTAGWRLGPIKAKKILFPTDFSKLSEAALSQAAALVRDAGGTLLIVHVEEPPSAYGGGEMYYGIPDPDSNALRAMLTEVAPVDPTLKCEYHLLSGDPATEIVRLAEQQEVDLIVMATHGRSGLRRLLLGSTAEAVVRHAPCAVLSVKLPHHR